MQKLQRVTEAKVVSEYLQNEFYQSEFHESRERFENLVLRPDLKDSKENELRLELLLRRRPVWNELPHDMQWWQVRIDPADLDRIYVLARREWKRIANGSLLLKDVTSRIRSGYFSGESVRKVQDMSYCLRRAADGSFVVLIAPSEDKPLIILEGNHRLVAACLMSAEPISQLPFQIIAGFSSQMNACCCYHASLSSRWRRIANSLRSLFTADSALSGGAD